MKKKFQEQMLIQIEKGARLNLERIQKGWRPIVGYEEGNVRGQYHGFYTWSLNDQLR